MDIATSFRRRGWMLAALLTLAAPAVALAQPREVIGTSITLEPPAGFTQAERFAGFGQEATLASIMVTELPGAFSEMDARLTPEALAEGGMTVRSADSLTVGGRPGRLFALTQQVDGVAFEKWVLVFGDEDGTAFVTGAYPRESAATLSEPIRLAVLSARRSGRPVGDPFEGIGFRIDPGSRLRIAERMGNTLAINGTGTLPNDDPGAPFLVVGPSISEVELDDVEAFSRIRAGRLGNMLRLSSITGGGPVTIDGGAGWELFADVTDLDDETPIKMYQVVIPEGGNYILLQAFVDEARAAAFIPEFQAIARSLRRTRSSQS
jgi:hypothetical protein